MSKVASPRRSASPRRAASPRRVSSPRRALPKPNVGFVRVAHAAPGAPNVDVYVDGAKALSNVAYKAISKYNALPVGRHEIVVKVANTPNVVLSERVTIEKGKKYTAVAHGNVKEKVSLLVVKDKVREPTADKARVHFIHASYAAPAVDIYANKTIKVVNNVGYGKDAFVEVKAGAYDLSVTPHGTSNVVLNLPGVKVDGKTNYVVIATGLPGNAQFPLTVILDKQ